MVYEPDKPGNQDVSNSFCSTHEFCWNWQLSVRFIYLFFKNLFERCKLKFITLLSYSPLCDRTN